MNQVGIIESVAGETPPQLIAAFEHLRSSVRVFTVDDLQRSADEPQVDVVAVSARVPPAEVDDILLRFTSGETAPVVVVFADAHFEDIEQHILRGRDYVVPPFLPSLLSVRMQTCYESARFSRSIAESEARARLVAADRDMEIAREIQVGFLPETLPQPRGWELAASFRPARKVSGDFYDAFPMANGRRIAFVIADVCDKGVGAALFMALIRSLLRHTAEFSGLQSVTAEQFLSADDDAPLGGIPVVGATPMMNAIRSTNGYLTRNHAAQGYFATMFFGVLDPGTGQIAYVNCGHNPPLVLRADGQGSSLEHTGPAVGVIPDCLYSIAYTGLEPGDTLLLYTDGVTEARSADGDFFGDERLLRAVLPHGQPGAELLQGVEQRLDAHIGGADQFDDITMMAIHRVPAPAWVTPD
ncbi:MAG: PP2C family protein-serine/threonine phosphatase [Trebonia sp.]